MAQARGLLMNVLESEVVVSAVGFQSDSQLVDTCLARLRVDARLDDDPVLPTIELLPDADVIEVDASELVLIDCESVRDVPSAATIVRDSVRTNTRPQKEVPTLRKLRGAAQGAAPAERKHARWPLFVCALVATYFGATAFLRSPLGAKPEVQHVVKVSQTRIAGAIHTTKSLVRR